MQLERRADALNADDLTARLTGLAERDNSPSSERRRCSSESTDATQLPDGSETARAEASSRLALIEAGGRPACSSEEVSHIQADPTTRYTAILSWLSDGPDTETGTGELKTVFSRQLRQWWIFRKSQWSNRGLDIDEEGLSAYIESSRRQDEREGLRAMVSAPSFNESMQRMWDHMPAPRQLSEDQSFSAYKEAVQARLKPYNFKRRPQLKKSPRQQDAWTDWLEYLNFEKWYLERLTAIAESRNEKFLKSWDLLNAGEPDSDKTRDFLRATKPYKRAVAAVYYQKHRVDWVIKEARAMETEISQKRATAKSNTKEDKRKRRRDDEEDKMPPESQSKRAKGQVKVEDSASGTTDRPQTRSLRRSGRLRTGV